MWVSNQSRPLPVSATKKILLLAILGLARTRLQAAPPPAAPTRRPPGHLRRFCSLLCFDAVKVHAPQPLRAQHRHREQHQGGGRGRRKHKSKHKSSTNQARIEKTKHKSTTIKGQRDLATDSASLDLRAVDPRGGEGKKEEAEEPRSSSSRHRTSATGSSSSSGSSRYAPCSCSSGPHGSSRAVEKQRGGAACDSEEGRHAASRGEGIARRSRGGGEDAVAMLQQGLDERPAIGAEAARRLRKNETAREIERGTGGGEKIEREREKKKKERKNKEK